MVLLLTMKTKNNRKSEKMLKYTQFCNAERARAFFKTAARASEAGDFLNIFSRFLRLIFL